MGFLLGALGFGKAILEAIFAFLKGIAEFAGKYPFQFLTIVFALGLMGTGWWGFNQKQALIATQKIVEEKVAFITGQNKVITQYVTALKVEKANHVADIKKQNDSILSIKQAADKLQQKAQAAAAQHAKDKAKYDDLATKYDKANTVIKDNPQLRIDNEEKTNNQFFKDWKAAK